MDSFIGPFLIHMDSNERRSVLLADVSVCVRAWEFDLAAVADRAVTALRRL